MRVHIEAVVFVPIRDVDNNRGGGAELLSDTPCKQRGGGKAGTRVVKYENSDFEASGAKRITFASDVIINQSVLDPYQSRICMSQAHFDI